MKSTLHSLIPPSLREELKVLAFDLDGTALDPYGEITPALAKVFSELNKKGKLLVIATGRAPHMVKPLLEVLPKKTMFLLSVGSMIFDDLAIDNTLYLEAINKRVAKEILNLAKDLPDFKYYGNSKKGLYGSIVDHWCYSPDGDASLSNLENQEEIVKLFFHDLTSASERINKLKATIEDKYGDYVTCALSSTFTLDVTAKGVSKLSALDFLLAKEGLTRDNLVSFGDSFNDAEMLFNSRLGFYMSNSPEAFKESFKSKKHLIEIGSNREDGLAKALIEIFDLSIKDSDEPILFKEDKDYLKHKENILN